MNRINKILTTTVIGGSIIMGGVAINNMNTYTNELEGKLRQKDVKIHELSIKNDEILAKNNDLLKKNKELLIKANENTFKVVNFDPNNVKTPSNVSEKQLEIVFKQNHTYSALIGLEEAFVEAEREYGVNAIFVLGIISQESGFGTSRRAVEDNNMAGYEVYSDSSNGRLFSSKKECVLQVARLLSNEYLSKDGNYYKGVDIYSINNSYSADKNWSNYIIKMANDYVNEINNI